MIEKYEKIYEGDDLASATLDLMFLRSPGGTLKNVYLYVGGNVSARTAFNLTKNGVALWADDDRLMVASGSDVASKADLSIVTTRGDVLVLDLEDCPEDGILAPVTLILEIDDGEESGGGVTSHSDLTDLDADDHLQYFNEARGDARYVQSADLTSTDALPEGATNLYFTASRVWATVLTGIAFTTNAAITAADSILIALGKLQAQISNRVVKNADIVGAAKTKITYDAKGLVTGGADATTDDISEGATNKYFTDTRAQAALTSALSTKADLVAGKVPSSQLPSFVDDVLEYANLAALPTVGETGKIYVTIDTNFEYRWSGSTYIQLVSSPGTTDEVPESGTPTNKYFTESRVLATLLTGYTAGSNTVIAAGNSLLTALKNLQAQISQNATDVSANTTAISGKVSGNTAISGATKTKITYDSKGLVTSGTDATSDDISEGATNKYFTASGVLATLLTGYTIGSNAVIAGGDSILAAFRKLQGQISQNASDISTQTANIATNTANIATNTTNIADRLTRTANDFSTFSAKATPVSADLLLIEDSAAAGAKKKITVGSLPGGATGAASADVQIFTTTGANTWTKPAGAKTVEVFLIAGGGGGGSGRKGAASTTRTGGGGGGGGSMAFASFVASVLGSTETVTVGAGGAGGASRTTNTTDGSPGSIGGSTSFGSWLIALGGNFGLGGSGASTSAGAARSGFPSSAATDGGAGGIAQAGAVDSNAGATTLLPPAGGGGGGGVTAANASRLGGAGGAVGFGSTTSGKNSTLAGGAVNTNGSDSGNYAMSGGSGGGGGNGSVTGNANAGGNGGLYGAGGGGGGASQDSTGNSGAGGTGGNGICIVVTYF